MNLPEYNPDDKVWQRIEAKLNDENKTKVLAKMPEYEPNEAVWDHIAAQLKPAKFFYLKSYLVKKFSSIIWHLN